MYHLPGCMTEGIPYSGDISVTSSGLHCIEWDWYRRALLDEPNQSLHLVDIGLFPDETYSDLGAKCRFDSFGSIYSTTCLYL